MSKPAADELAAFVDLHPTMAVAELLSLMTGCCHTPHGADRDVVCAYLQRLVSCDALPDALRTIANELYREWHVDAINPRCQTEPSSGGWMH